MRTPRQILESARSIAVVGASSHPWRDSNRIFLFLKSQGYRVYPVNPTIDVIEGDKSYTDVQSLPERVDIVVVFRNPDYVMAIVEDAIAATAPVVWLQLGVGNRQAEQRALAAGLEVVSERCIAVDYRVLNLAPVGERT